MASDLLQKYILSPVVELIPAAQIRGRNLPDVPEVQQILAEKLFVLSDDHTWHLLNPVTKKFLEAFRQARTLPEVIDAFAKEAGCAPDLIQKKMTTFFQRMRQRNILIIPPKKTIVSQSGTKFGYQIGQELDDYLIQELIFSKNEVAIYKAIRRHDGLEVALKTLWITTHTPVDTHPQIRHSFGQEFRLMDALGHHPNICRLLDYVENIEKTYAVLELIDDVNLRSFTKRSVPSLAQRINLADQLLQAMAFIHLKQMVHGDIHLSNILVHRQSTVKLIDFNLSNRLHPTENEIVRHGGVYQYIPPEKVDSQAFRIVNSPADCRSEVFQLGVVLYFLFYEIMPFDAFTWPALAQKIRTESPTFPWQTPQGETIPPFFLDTLQKALAKSPDQRFPSAQELSEQWQSCYIRYNLVQGKLPGLHRYDQVILKN